MNSKKNMKWTRLDNASKIFPATSNATDTKVFRFSCELYDEVDPTFLQQALDETIESFPFFKSILRRGVFWYYFEASDLSPKVEMESKPVCAPIYHKHIKNLLFRVFYYHNRINLEVFHALSDGAGALWFMKTLVYHYLLLQHGASFGGNLPKLDYSASISEKMNDSFGRHFPGEKRGQPKKKKSTEVRPLAYRIRGSKQEENRMSLIEGSLSVQAVLEEAHRHDTTLTVFITSLFLYSIYKEMPAHGKNRPVILSIPINLRQFFQSDTARNFFSTMPVSHHFGQGNTEFKDVVQGVKEGFSCALQEEELNETLNRLMSIEKNPFARVVPLPIKDFSLKIANRVKDRRISAALSNVGRVILPTEFDEYIQQFSLCTSARRPQICMCSYGDRLVVSFTSPLQETEIQRTFFEFLAKRGIEVEISSNL